MDEQTTLVLALQLIALCCIACALILYLLCRIRQRDDVDSGSTPARYPFVADNDVGPTVDLGAGRAVLVTCCDTALGLQLAMHLGDAGFRVFAGVKKGAEPTENGQQSDSLPAKILRAHAKHLEAEQNHEAVVGAPSGSLVLLPLDVTREDLLHDAVDTVRRHLPAGHDGLHAVINTAGLCARGRLEVQENSQWDALLKVNVVGSLRAARAFLPLLRKSNGRLLNVGAAGLPSGLATGPGFPAAAEAIGEAGLVVFTAARYAVEGATAALRSELAPLGVDVVSLQPADHALAESFFGPPRRRTRVDDVALSISYPSLDIVDVNVAVLPRSGLRAVEDAILSNRPRPNYVLGSRPGALERCASAVCGRIACLPTPGFK